MKKMLGISLIVIGGLVLTSGIIIVINSAPPKAENLDQAVSLVMADGVLTPKEEKLIREIASEEGKDGDYYIEQIKLELASSEEDSETEIIDINAKAGLDFEKFVVKKFDSDYFIIKNWASDKYVEGVYAETNLHPDLQLELNLRDGKYPFAVECKWRSKRDGESIWFAEDYQLKRYQKFERDNGYPVFIVLGIGGKPSNPEELYIIPVSLFNTAKQPKNKLVQLRKDISKNFFFDGENAVLR